MLKKLLPLFLLLLIVFIFNPNNASAVDAVDCDSYGGTVICGPTSGNGNAEVLYDGIKVNLGDVSVVQAIWNIRNKSRVTMGTNATLNFDGGGCLSSCDNEDPTARTYYLNILEVDNSEFFHGSGTDSTVYMKDENQIKASTDSSVSLGYIKEKNTYTYVPNEAGDLIFKCPNDGCYTKLDISSKDSELSIGSIEFENPDSFVNIISIENEEANRGKYRLNINKGIKASQIKMISLKNADAIIGGDIIAYGSNGSGGAIAEITLYYSDLVLRGNEISQVQRIQLVEKSIFKVDPMSGRHTIVMGSSGAPLIQLESGSQFIAQDIKTVATQTDFVVTNEDTIFKADRIYMDNLLNFTSMNFYASLQAKVEIGTIDTRLYCIEGDCGSSSQRLKLDGDSSSLFQINEILIDSDDTILILNDAYGRINKIDYDNSVVNIEGRTTENVTMQIGSINLLNEATKYNIKIKDQKLQIDSINFKKSEQLEFNISESTINSGNITCSDYCKETSFNGIGNATLNIVSFNSNIAGNMNSAEFSNTFSGITINVSESYNSSGTFIANDSTLNFGSMNGTYDSINLFSSSLTLNKESDITLTSGDILIDNLSSFTIKGEEIFNNPNEINIDNYGKLNILAGNTLNSIINNINATTVLDGKSNIKLVDNYGILELHAGASIDELNNMGTNENQSKVVLYGANRVEKYDHNEFSELVFMITTKQSMPTLTIGEMTNPYYLGEISVSFDNLSVIKPGLKNRYDLIETEQGSIGIDYDQYSEMLNILPPWLIHEENIEQNTNNSGETAWVEIQRLTNYTTLMKAVPGYGQDSAILNLAESIDRVVFSGQTTKGLEDVVNSLDLNSGCTASDQLIYEIHQGVVTDVDISSAPCLYTMAENMNKLKPVSNEVYALYSHTNVTKSLDTLLEANREYVYSDEVYSWYKSDIGYTSLADKGYDSGFNGVSSNFYAGLTFAPLANYNFSGMLGFGLGNLNGNSSLYDGGTNTIMAGLAASYLKSTYFVSLSTVVGISNFDTNRNIDFLDNEYSDNRSTVSTSKLSVIDMAVKLEAGDEYVVNSSTFLTPKVFISQSLLHNSGYEEFGSSASLKVNSNNMAISDLGVGVELRRELLLPKFLGIEKSFWYPKIGFNVVERFYKKPSTEMKFVGTSDDFYTKIDSADYSGLLAQLYGSLLYQNKDLAVQVAYNGDASLSGYMNHSINATLKYSFK